MQAFHNISASFDDPNLIGVAGLVPLMRLAERAGLHTLLEQHLSVPSPNAAVKASSVIGGMLAGADSIDDCDVLRHGAMDKVFTGVRAPSTLGTFLRAFTFGHVRQLDAVASRTLAGLVTVVPQVLAGATDPDGIAFIDIDDTMREAHGYRKQGVEYGYNRVKGLNAQVVTVSSPLCAPLVAGARLRKGNVVSGHGAATLLASSITTVRAAGVTGRVMVRADSGYYRHDLITAAVRAKAWFSVTARMDPAVKKAIAGIAEDDWVPIKYPNAIWDEDEQRWISSAQLAETTFTAFTSYPKIEQVTCRLVVRRVERLGPAARAALPKAATTPPKTSDTEAEAEAETTDGATPAVEALVGEQAAQLDLFTLWRHHGFVTNSTLSAAEADATHRDHAIIEQVICELKNAGLAHLPSGRFHANSAWLALSCIAFNLMRTAGAAASVRHAKARWATLRTHLMAVPARISSSARRMVLHLPTQWPWQDAWHNLWAAATAPT